MKPTYWYSLQNIGYPDDGDTPFEILLSAYKCLNSFLQEHHNRGWETYHIAVMPPAVPNTTIFTVMMRTTLEP